jgi:DNA mismatch endonuclease, patch repair protein
MDVFSREKRSQIMSRVSGKNTKPELIVRSLLHRMGYRFRLHRKDLPGKPDITLPKYKKVIFIHGCFWHGHKHCKRSSLPNTNREFWEHKIRSNAQRDYKNISSLTEKGWEVMVLWSCQIKNKEDLISKLIEFIENKKKEYSLWAG